MWWRTPSLGLDLGASAVKACQVKGEGKAAQLIRAVVAPMPLGTMHDGKVLNPGALTATLAELRRQKILPQAKVVLALTSARDVITRVIDLPLMTAEELAEQVRWEAEQHIPFDLSEVDLDHSVLRRRHQQGTMDVLLVAAQRARAEELTGPVRRAGFTRVQLVLSSAVYERALAARGLEAPERALAVVDMGASRAMIDLFVEGQLAGRTTLPGGSLEILAKVQRRLGVSAEEAAELLRAAPDRDVGGAYRGGAQQEMVASCADDGWAELSQEVARALEQLLSSGQIEALDQLLLTGGAAEIPAFERGLSQQLRCPVGRWAPVAAIPKMGRQVDADLIEHAASRLSLAYSLALEARA